MFRGDEGPPERCFGNSPSRNETSVPGISSMPNWAHEAAMRSWLAVVSWSVREIAEIPILLAFSANCSGVSEPSENVEWV